ncbi:hypothetical protein CSOJ01_07723 [Colletotrichum sojae]|uniref:Yeast cell wall synthesis Kre9/Knh1-like N-terminal domain-containing protein n=1 Tax=Colletotrichum sojae TaxID=2175907 RepID=A0A8H6J834_9PEZI|nr:hypothetical protein CSOJ01_07723 [Colletotrichum sojae]
MKTFTSVIVAGFAALAQAVQLTNSDFSITAGEPFTITWSDNQGPVTLTLKNGPSTDLKTVTTITTGASGNSFTWTPSASLPSDTYALEISDGTEPNYSNQFTIAGASGTATAASSTGSASATTAASSSASATVTTTVTPASSSASESASVSSAANSTVASSTVATSTRVRECTSATSESTTAPTTVPGGDAGRIGSPIALIGLTIAAMLYFQ